MFLNDIRMSSKEGFGGSNSSEMQRNVENNMNMGQSLNSDLFNSEEEKMTDDVTTSSTTMPIATTNSVEEHSFYFDDDDDIDPDYNYEDDDDLNITLEKDNTSVSDVDVVVSSTIVNNSNTTTNNMPTLSISTAKKLLYAVLSNIFSFSSFNPGQETAILSVLSNQPTLVILPTGSGKTLCYTLPALLFPGLTLVITPLISLMQDQMEKLPPTLPAASWSSLLSPQQTETVMNDLRNGRIRILFVSPEKVLSPGFQRFMTTQLPSPGVTFTCIDEVHCVSEWSHCFRPSYLRLAKVLFEKLNVRAVLGLTATATKQTQSTIQKTLRVTARNTYRASIYRPNLLLHASIDMDKIQSLEYILHTEPYKSMNSIIIYASTQLQCDVLTQRLIGYGKKAVSYHAGRTLLQRKAAQKQFMTSKVQIIVATIAFGMGLDKSDVRAVIHFNMPRTLEHYIQEVGRAGRDGKPSFGHCFYSEEDVLKISSLSHSEGIEKMNVKEILHRIFTKRIDDGDVGDIDDFFTKRQQQQQQQQQQQISSMENQQNEQLPVNFIVLKIEQVCITES